MRRTFKAEIFRLIDRETIYLNIDLGFQTWKVVQVRLMNPAYFERESFWYGDRIVVHIDQKKYIENYEPRYEYEAVVVRNTQQAEGE